MIYTPSSGDVVNFTLQEYTVPLGDAVNFELAGTLVRDIIQVGFIVFPR